MVCVPFNVACGFCANCERGLTAYCQTTNPDPRVDGAAYGFAGMGPYPGGQAELLRVPYGDFNCLVLPEDARDPARQRDYVMLADIFPTGWHVTELARVRPGDSVAIYGAGPVGQMAALSCAIKSAGPVMIVDYHDDRLRLAEEAGAVPIDGRAGPPAEQIKELTDGRGADRGCECVGYQATDAEGNEHPNITLNNLVDSVRFAGTIGVVGQFVPRGDAVAFDYGGFWFKGQTMGAGLCDVKRYNRMQLDLIRGGKARPSYIVSHELPLGAAPDGYEHFDRRDDGWTKVVLHP
jgi:glutathione-independent formaldehyde dehydrogenase